MKILNLGAGIQSTRLYLEHDFDAAIFADTQEEPEAVYRHLDWLESLGRTPILRASAGSLGEALSTGTSFASIPAFSAGNSGSFGVARRACTSDYKIGVIEKVIRRKILGLPKGKRVPKGIHVKQFYGITIDEAGRSQRIRQNWQHKWASPHFPLIESWQSRQDCIVWLKRYGIAHEVPRSACVFCPYKSNYEWRRLRDEDDSGWARAIEIDEALRTTAVANRGIRNPQYLHRSCIPLKQADIDNNAFGAQHTLGFASTCTGGCGL